jgi:hypothetical protein
MSGELFDIQYKEWNSRLDVHRDDWLPWIIVDLTTGKCIARYKDRKYAFKQVKRKYNKIIRSMEKELLG